MSEILWHNKLHRHCGLTPSTGWHSRQVAVLLLGRRHQRRRGHVVVAAILRT
jgi:hypothetical protein